jgi:hypothetical protein
VVWLLECRKTFSEALIPIRHHMTNITIPYLLLMLLVATGLGYWIGHWRNAAVSEVAAAQHKREMRQIKEEYGEKIAAEQKLAMVRIEQVRSEERGTLEAALRTCRAEHAQSLRETIDRYEQKLKDRADSDLSVTVHPFVNTQSKKSLFTNETQVDIGYKYQLFVRGLPCFEPHTVVVDSTTEKEVDEGRILMFKNKALELAQAVASAGNGGSLNKVITIAKVATRVLR